MHGERDQPGPEDVRDCDPIGRSLLDDGGQAFCFAEGADRFKAGRQSEIGEAAIDEGLWMQRRR